MHGNIIIKINIALYAEKAGKGEKKPEKIPLKPYIIS